MARKITGGQVGDPSLGGISANSESTITAAENRDIVIDPLGTGRFIVAADMQIQAQGDLRLADADSSNWVALQAPSSVGSNVTWTLPATDGTNGQSLITNGSGQLSFTTVGPAITDNTSDSGVNYPILGTITTGSLTSARVTSTRLTFQPSSGTLTVSALQVNGKANSLRPENIQTSTYTLALADAGQVVNMNPSGPVDVIVPTNAAQPFPIGSVVWIYRQGAGAVNLTASGGVTLTATGTMAANEELYLRKRGTDSWVVFHIPQTATLTVTPSGFSPSVSGGFTTQTLTSGSGSLTLS